MEEGKVYDVHYEDDTQHRLKTLTYVDCENLLFRFMNDKAEFIEIPIFRILRIEEKKTKSLEINPGKPSIFG